MSSIAASADGTYIFLALEDTAGFQLVAMAARENLSTWSAVYDPNAGSACNVATVPGNIDAMYFYGNFGSGVGIIKHTISTATNSDISPASLGTKVINTLVVNPSDENEFIATVDTDQDVIYTDDSGTTYTTLNSASGMSVKALDVLWSGAYFPHRFFVGGNNGGDTDLIYSPNAGSTMSNKEGTALDSETNICAIQAVES